jgi:hypothetical protein
MKKYKLRQEHKKQLEPYAKKWIDIIMNTNQMTDEDKNISIDCVQNMYKMVNLEIPKERIVFVKSPIMGAFVAAIANYVWWLRGADSASATKAATGDATRNATRDATRDATWGATVDATFDVTWDATWDATADATEAATADATSDVISAAISAATYDATNDATDAATEAATLDAATDATADATEAAIRDAIRDATLDVTIAATADATRVATWGATWGATDDATRVATKAAISAATRAATKDAIKDDKKTFDLENWYIQPNLFKDIITNIRQLSKSNNIDVFIKNIYSIYNGGNFWGQYLSFLSFFKDIAKLDIDYSKYAYYEKLAIHSSVRYMHKKFCIICDRPLFIKKDEQNRPHCDTGAFMKWSDGSALYAVHGVRVPAWIIEEPYKITVEKIDKEQNTEIKRVMIDKFGISNYIEKSNSIMIHKDELGELYKKEVKNDEEIRIVKVINSTKEPDGTYKTYWLRVPPSITTAKEAVSWTFGFEPKEYNPIIET